MDFETKIKLHIYHTIADTTRVPTSRDVAVAVGRSVEQVEAAFESLAMKRLLVLEQGDQSRIRMAPPFSGIETPFRTTVQGNAYYANCIWDAFGVVAALGRDAEIISSDGFTKEPMTIRVVGGVPEPIPCVMHYAVPAAKWWEDIVFT